MIDAYSAESNEKNLPKRITLLVAHATTVGAWADERALFITLLMTVILIFFFKIVN